MNGCRERTRKTLAMLLSIVFVFCHVCIASLAEEIPATPTDLAGEAEPFEQTETVEGVRITVTVRDGARTADGNTFVAKVSAADFVSAAEEVLGIEQGDGRVIRHAVYRFSFGEMSGPGKVRMEKLGLTGLQEEYPGSRVSVYVLRYDETVQSLKEKVRSIPVIIQAERNTISFALPEPGLYDVVTVAQLPEESLPADEKPAAEEADEAGSADNPAEEESTADTEQEGPAAEPENGEAEPAETEPVSESEKPEETGAAAPAQEPAEREQEVPAAESKQIEEAPAAEMTDEGQKPQGTPEPAEVLSGTGSTEAEPLSGAAEEDDRVKAFVTRCYWLILGREPDQGGLADWTGRLKSKSATAAEIILGFFGSREFIQMHKPSEEMIEILYRTMLNRASDESGRQSWSNLIASGASLNKLLNGFCTSAEFKSICESYGIEAGSLPEGAAGTPVAYSERITAFVTRCYREALSREPDANGLQFWCNQLTGKNMSFSEVAAGFVFSDEMNNKNLNDEAFVKVLYRLYLGREAESAGLEFWKGKLKEEMTREQVNEGFANSREFAGIVAAYDSESGAEPEYNYILVPDDQGIVVNNGAKVQIRTSPELVKAGTALKWLSSDTKIFTVSQDGELTGCYPGKATLKVYLPDGKILTETTVTVKANYRAVLFSESTFAGGVIRRNRGDVKLMKNVLSSVTGPDGELYKVYSYDDLVAKDVYTKINQLLVAPSRDGDVSMFFFASHGDYKSTSQKYAGRLWCKNKETWLELPELAKTLAAAKGKVIVILESCGPGAAVREWPDENLSAASPEGETVTAEEIDAPDLTEMIISTFAAADPGLTVYQTNLADEPLSGAGTDTAGQAPGGNLFLTEKFVVLTASAYLQASYMVGEHSYNLFPYWLSKGVGTSGAMPADIEHGNGDGKLTLNELYQYVHKHTSFRQTPQVYPKNSDYVLFLRK